MLTQQHISATTPMGGNLVDGGGATFRVWAPNAAAVYLCGVFNGSVCDQQVPGLLLTKDGNGYWAGFLHEAREGDLYRFYVIGPAGGTRGCKRDPYARELAEETYPACFCILRSADDYPWHDQAFVTPDFSNMIIYQAHIGTYAIQPAAAGAQPVASTFLDLIGKIPYLVALGINVLQPLPVVETETEPSMGYDGADLFAPDFPYYLVTKPNPTNDPAIAAQNAATTTLLTGYLATINSLLTARNATPLLTLDQISTGPLQLKAMVDLCHLYGIAVCFDVVYNHAGGFSIDGQFDDTCLYFMDRQKMGDNNDSLYFTDQDRGTGGLSFALWNNPVRQFLIDNAIYWLNEFHADGFRYDEISSLLSMNKDSGWSFCHDLTATVRSVKPRILQNAEYWEYEFNDYPHTTLDIVSPAPNGAGFDVVQHDVLRTALRNAVQAASQGASAPIDVQAIAAALNPPGLAHGWQAVTCIENHDLVKAGRDPRVPTLADGGNHRSWYARSRTRVAMSILLTAPGIPQLFMGQEFLEDKQWDTDPTTPATLLWWEGLLTGADQNMVDHLRFTQDLIRLRWLQPALRCDNVNPFHVNPAARVLAYHRWIEAAGEDVVVIANFSETTSQSYNLGFPIAGWWNEVFNSDVYDNWVNPICAGNGAGINAIGPAMHGFPASASVVLPANAVVVFARM